LTPPVGPLVAGNDYTVLVYGPSSGPAVSLLTDNNQAPTSARIRLINVAVPSNSGSGVITLTDNNLTLVSQLQYGTASAYSTVNTGTSVLNLSSPDQGFPNNPPPAVCNNTTTCNVGLYGVYSLVIGGTNAAPTVWFVKDR
jgi:archaellin